MKSWAKWTAKTVLVTTGFAAAGGGFAGVAHAGTGTTNKDNISVLGGNQVSAPVTVPLDVCGNAAAILGIAAAGCQGGAEVVAHHGPAARPGGRSHGRNTGNLSAGSGNNIQIPVRIAANVCGNAVGKAQASCRGGVSLPGGGSAGGGGSIKHAGLSAGNITIGSGNQVKAPVSVPANVCGNAVAVLGGSNAGCAGGASVGRSARRSDDLLSSTQLAGLGALPGVANLAGLTKLPLLQSVADGSSLLPANTLSAFTSNVGSGGMSGDSFATLAIGALLAGAAALKLAGRRPKARETDSGEVSA
jgi:hypothetical protein